MKADSLIFDLDGTLWDACWVVAEGRNRMIKKLGLNLHDFTVADIQSTMGLTTDQVYEKSFKSLSKETYAEFRKQTGLEVAALIGEGRATLYPGVREFLPALAKKMPLFIVSNCSLRYLEAFLSWSGLTPHFRQCLCHGTRDGSPGLSKADNIKKVVKDYGLKQPLYVGDTKWDHMSSTEAGVPYLHVDYGFGQANGPCEHISAFADLTKMFA